eukprot:sb/3470788/
MLAHAAYPTKGWVSVLGSQEGYSYDATGGYCFENGGKPTTDYYNALYIITMTETNALYIMEVTDHWSVPYCIWSLIGRKNGKKRAEFIEQLNTDIPTVTKHEKVAVHGSGVAPPILTLLTTLIHVVLAAHLDDPQNHIYKMGNGAGCRSCRYEETEKDNDSRNPQSDDIKGVVVVGRRFTSILKTIPSRRIITVSLL